MTDSPTVRNVDPILTAILDKRFDAVVDLVAGAMMRTSMSPIFAEARDLAAAIFDRKLQLIAQRDYLPVLASNLPAAIHEIVDPWEGDIQEGDVFIHNDAYGNNSHLPDINVAKPVFYKGELVFWVVSKGHHADVGGRGICGYDPTSGTCWDDGLIIKSTKLYEAGRRARGIWQFLAANTKLPDLITADLECQVGSCVVGERALLEICEQYGVEPVYDCLNELMDSNERMLRSKIETIPDGVYYGEKSFDDDIVHRGIPVTVRTKVTVSGSDVTIDFSESDPQVPSYMNITWGNTYSVAMMAILYFVEGDTPRNDGAMRPIHIVTKKGTVVDPEFPAPCTMCTCAGTETIFEAISLALAPVRPEWATAAHGKMSLGMYTGINPETGRPFATLDFGTNVQGSGGTLGFDGWPTGGPSHTMGQLRLPDPEVTELTMPQIVWRAEMVPGREGAGQFRGGMGSIYRTQYKADAKAAEVSQGHAAWAVPSGIFGGQSPPPCYSYVIRAADGSKEQISVNSFWEIREGDIYEQVMQGGAGYGDPFTRDPQLVLKDVQDELLTLDRARDVYGTIIKPVDGNFEIDIESTEALREAHKKS